MSSAAELHAELRQLEQRKADRSRRIELVRAANARRREQLALLAQGHPQRRRTRAWVLCWIASAALLIGVVPWLRGRDAPRVAARAFRPALPQLLITSVPDGARISFRGAAPKLPAAQRLVTPLAFEAPAGSHYEATVTAAGHASQTRALVAHEHGGEHWHVELQPAAAPAAP